MSTDVGGQVGVQGKTRGNSLTTSFLQQYGKQGQQWIMGGEGGSGGWRKEMQL